MTGHGQASASCAIYPSQSPATCAIVRARFGLSCLWCGDVACVHVSIGRDLGVLVWPSDAAVELHLCAFEHAHHFVDGPILETTTRLDVVVAQASNCIVQLAAVINGLDGRLDVVRR